MSVQGAFLSASQRGDALKVSALLADGADVHDLQDYALRVAVYAGHLATARVLLAAGANIYANNSEALVTAHRRAAKWGDEFWDNEMVALLEKHTQNEPNRRPGLPG